MSGGSYDYLYSRDAGQMVDYQHHLDFMSDRLAELGYPDAARETRELLLDIRAYSVRADLIIGRMEKIWKAVEWLDSADWGEGEVKKAVDDYRRKSC